MSVTEQRRDAVTPDRRTAELEMPDYADGALGPVWVSSGRGCNIDLKTKWHFRLYSLKAFMSPKAIWFRSLAFPVSKF
ncbi:hypothetical protein EVAR_28515_1 [Eumeta japonica]|uniref:Uncharacterized protein n=1 Tax=Eumeta variegata TaxID=151549 RepID=A0A4C1WQA4_EUMVA|nr:hypothetical protein EVAR_28515_1 [Eumeta japonica]